MNSTLTGFIACKGPVPALESLAHHSSPTAPNLSTSSDIIDLAHSFLLGFMANFLPSTL